MCTLKHACLHAIIHNVTKHTFLLIERIRNMKACWLPGPLYQRFPASPAGVMDKDFVVQLGSWFTYVLDQVVFYSVCLHIVTNLFDCRENMKKHKKDKKKRKKKSKKTYRDMQSFLLLAFSSKLIVTPVVQFISVYWNPLYIVFGINVFSIEIYWNTKIRPVSTMMTTTTTTTIQQQKTTTTKKKTK